MEESARATRPFVQSLPSDRLNKVHYLRIVTRTKNAVESPRVFCPSLLESPSFHRKEHLSLRIHEAIIASSGVVETLNPGEATRA